MCSIFHAGFLKGVTHGVMVLLDTRMFLADEWIGGDPGLRPTFIPCLLVL